MKKELLAPGDRVAFLLANSIERVCVEQAALALGLVVASWCTWNGPGSLADLLSCSIFNILF